MGLSPEEEDIFSTIVAGLHAPTVGSVPVPVVVLSFVVVGIGVLAAAMLGVHHHVAALFYGSFSLGLSGSLAVKAVHDRRNRRS